MLVAKHVALHCMQGFSAVTSTGAMQAQHVASQETISLFSLPSSTL